jgi:ATP-dependent DNA ligase
MYESERMVLTELMMSIILDGEMLVWDPQLDKYLAFGTLKTAALGQSILRI